MLGTKDTEVNKVKNLLPRSSLSGGEGTPQQSAVMALSGVEGSFQRLRAMSLGGNECSGSLEGGQGGYSGLKGRGQLDFANRTMSVVVVVGTRRMNMALRV